MSVQATIRNLKEKGEDYEWYPTSDEIIKAMWKDLTKRVKGDSEGRYSSSKGMRYKSSYRNDEEDVLEIGSFLDIGTGDGRILLNPPSTSKLIVQIEKKIGIEKSTYHADTLIGQGVWLLGRDYLKMTLIDKKFDVVFSNPPYSIFKQWCEKLLSEVDAKYIYLTVPVRWKDDVYFSGKLKSKGEVKVIGTFDFDNGDRSARAKADLIRISQTKETGDVFKTWVEENIGEFKVKKRENLKEERDFKEEGITEKKDIARTLVESYEADMMRLINVFKSINELDFGLMMELGLSSEGVHKTIYDKIQTLKFNYWEKAFACIDAFKTRLTHSTSDQLLKDMKEFKELDFNEDNIRNIVIWVVENFNDNSEKQLLKCYNDLTYFGSVRAYKSNDKWINDHWRYQKPFPERNMLDYRIVTSGTSFSKINLASSPDYGFGWHTKTDNLICDLSVVAHSLGYPNTVSVDGIEFGKQRECLDKKGKVLFTFRAYKNKNLHIKMRSDLLQSLNIEVGKLKGWIKTPSDLQEEFDLSEKEAVRFFDSKLQLMKPSNVLLLTAGER